MMSNEENWPQPETEKSMVSSEDVIQAMRERHASLDYENAILTAQTRKLKRDLEGVRRELSHTRRLLREQSPETGVVAMPSRTRGGSPTSTTSSPRDETRR